MLSGFFVNSAPSGGEAFHADSWAIHAPIDWVSAGLPGAPIAERTSPIHWFSPPGKVVMTDGTVAADVGV
jgi:hypothetical protein